MPSQFIFLVVTTARLQNQIPAFHQASRHGPRPQRANREPLAVLVALLRPTAIVQLYPVFRKMFGTGFCRCTSCPIFGAPLAIAVAPHLSNENSITGWQIMFVRLTDSTVFVSCTGSSAALESVRREIFRIGHSYREAVMFQIFRLIFGGPRAYTLLGCRETHRTLPVLFMSGPNSSIH